MQAQAKDHLYELAHRHPTLRLERDDTEAGPVYELATKENIARKPERTSSKTLVDYEAETSEADYDMASPDRDYETAASSRDYDLASSSRDNDIANALHDDLTTANEEHDASTAVDYDLASPPEDVNGFEFSFQPEEPLPPSRFEEGYLQMDAE